MRDFADSAKGLLELGGIAGPAQIADHGFYFIVVTFGLNDGVRGRADLVERFSGVQKLVVEGDFEGVGGLLLADLQHLPRFLVGVVLAAHRVGLSYNFTSTNERILFAKSEE